MFALEWPGSVLHLETVRAGEGAEITLLGYNEPLEWSQGEDGLRIELPPGSEAVSKYAWTFRVG